MVKQVAAFFIIIGATLIGNSSGDMLSSFFLKTLKALPCLMDEPIPILNLPRLDPLKIQHLDFNLNLLDTIKATGSIDNLELTNLKSLEATETKYMLELRLPLIELKSDYEIDAKIMDEFSIWGQGDLLIKIKEILLGITIGFKSGNIVGIESFNGTLDVGGLDAVIHGLYNDEELSQAIGESISEAFPEIFKMYKENIDTFLNEKVPPLLDGLLGGKTLLEALNVFTNITNDPKAAPCLSK